MFAWKEIIIPELKISVAPPELASASLALGPAK